ncbi:MAG TPA: hypothetical protein VH092_18060 [Urbifossiella sp.]|nr:hypothetical protein [Urbifossiella sp.]
MGRRLADDEKVKILRAIFAEDIPHTDDSWTPPPKDEPPPEPPKVVIRGLGGPAAVVDAEELRVLVQETGVGYAAEVTAEEYGRLVYAAKMKGSPLLLPLLQARSSSPIFRFRNNDGRLWRPTNTGITT